MEEGERPAQGQGKVESEQEQQEYEGAEQICYPRRLSNAPTRYGIDEYVGTILTT